MEPQTSEDTGWIPDPRGHDLPKHWALDIKKKGRGQTFDVHDPQYILQKEHEAFIKIQNEERNVNR
ncbi:MAG: hypothetical protein HRT47_01660 [Candidatus Caenarcaniphilales bacterium]|nr:hypothetical protein [Candidatus Caenarcaniphilales bacterium]